MLLLTLLRVANSALVRQHVSLIRTEDSLERTIETPWKHQFVLLTAPEHER